MTDTPAADTTQPTPFKWEDAPDPNTTPYQLKIQGLVTDTAWMREAIIVTIAGVAWFLVGGRTAP